MGAQGRLRRREDFVAVLRTRRRGSHRLLGLAARPNGLSHNRCGFAVGRHVGNAVTRNRVKRRLRALLRSAPLRDGYDLVLSARTGAAAASHGELERAIESVAQSAGVLVEGKR